MNISGIKNAFVCPSSAYRGKPFWAWNGELKEEEIVRQVHVMKQMGLGGFFMHSRSGLITEYLGDEWFHMINAAADAAEKEGMEAWLYDEDRWPSGSAGGKVTEDERFRMKSLVVRKVKLSEFEPQNNIAALFAARMEDENSTLLLDYREAEDVTAESLNKAAEQITGRGTSMALSFFIVPDAPDPNYNGNTYIDTMNRAATQRFIELTHEQYAIRCGSRLGRSIKGIFTDEPHRGHCLDDAKTENGVFTCSMCWTDDIFDEFMTRCGYDIRPLLPELFFRCEKVSSAKLKHDYINLANDLFIERFADPINDWCSAHRLIFTGHVLHEDSLMNQTVPNGSLIRFYGHMGIPGIDCLGEWNDDYFIVKQLSSAARQNGQKWMLSELYGCTGWQFNLRSHKTVGDWQALFGVNLRCQHLSWYTMEGEAKRDYPASILHQSAWYRDYRAVEDYFSRFGMVMSEGEPCCDVLVLNPIESVWCNAYAGWANWVYSNCVEVTEREKRYKELFYQLIGHQIDYDYGEEQMLEKTGKIDTDGEGQTVLRVGKATYSTIVVTNMLTIRASTLELLRNFLKKGGHVIFAGELPGLVDALPDERIKEAAYMNGAERVASCGDELIEAVRRTSKNCVSVTDREGKTETDVFVQVRRNFGASGAYLCTLLNNDRNVGKNGLTLNIRVLEGLCAERWDLNTGKRYDASVYSEYENGLMRITIHLEAAGTACFALLPEKERLPAYTETVTISSVALEGVFTVKRDEPNVCVLDYCRWREKDGMWSDVKEVLKTDRDIREHYGLEYRGGGMLQPWFAAKTDRRKYGFIQMEYEFMVETLPNHPVYLAAERPEKNHYRINGIPLKYEKEDGFWIDDCFKKMKLPLDALRPGRNTITADLEFERISNIEAIYLLGDFGVRTEPQICLTRTLPSRVGLGDLAASGMPFYTGCITYVITPEQYEPAVHKLSECGERIVLCPDAPDCGCVRVSCGGKTEVLAWEPYEADISEAVKGKKEIEVTVIGTRRNIFGPLHQIPKRAKNYGPYSFVTEGERWTDEYMFLGSGLHGILLKSKR